jgi:hypothetical protein
MSKITIDVKNDNVEKVLLILENLKDGLIENIKVDKSVAKYKPTYQPPKNKVIKEGEAQSGKYINPATFKKRMSKAK